MKKKKLKLPKAISSMLRKPYFKYTKKERAIYTLIETRTRVEQRLTYNERILKNDSQKFRNKQLKPLRQEIKDLTTGIINLAEGRYRPSEKSLDIFEDAFKWVYQEGALIETLVNDPETNFKKLLLEELAKQGVNIYNPTELAKVLKGHSMTEIVEAAGWAADVGEDEKEAHYTAIKEDAVGYIDSIIDALDEQEKDYMKIYKKA